MIQYKLIKEYPGSPKLGSIENSCSHIGKGTIFYDAHPKFWQKVEELDYKILSFKLISNGNLLIKHSNELFGFSKGAYTKEDILSGDPKRIDFKTENTHDTYGYAINSVKRLSDGEVFTIGDFTTKGEIHKFEITEAHLSVSVGDQKTLLRTFEKLPKKTPLFTTEDGVEIFKGDKFSIVQVDTFQKINECKHPVHYPHKWKTFSTPEKAEEYIINNKPCLSIVELQKWFSSYGVQLTGLDDLRSIVKSKL